MATRLTEERRHQVRQYAGATLSAYEFLAFIIDRPELVPRFTDLGRIHPAIGTSMALWVGGHLLKPSLVALWIRLRAQLHGA